MNFDYFVYAILILLPLGGLWFTLQGGRLLWRAWRSTTWPVTPGRVIASHVERRDGGKAGRVHAALIRYRYEVDGRSYLSDRWNTSNDNFFHAEEDAVMLSREHLVGNAVTVHFDPERPENAVLEVGGFQKGVVVFGAGVFFLFQVYRLLGPLIVKLLTSRSS